MSDSDNRNITDVYELIRQSSSTGLNLPYEIQCFRGDTDTISVNAWLRILEKYALRHKLTDQLKIDLLDKYLRDSALEWYAFLPENESWTEIKEKMIKRFGQKVVQPAVQFIKVRYDSNKGMKAYYEEKRKLGIQAGLSEEHMVQLMIDCLPYHLKAGFVPNEINTLDTFYEKAIVFEAREKEKMKSAERYKIKATKRTSIEILDKATKFKKKSKPPLPCKICTDLGFKNRFHWMSDCRNKKESPKEHKNLN